ncbi:MAG TPA: hypothetical protein PKY19_02870 [Oscillospiraceae bacterium]|nr:hypothetical protein [Oscillospiraceae bacterium]
MHGALAACAAYREVCNFPATLVPDEYRFTNPDPYAEPESLQEERRNRNFWFGEDGHIHVKNLSAFWLPELTMQREIGGTVYSVTGSYEGTETLDKKLERILEQNAENGEDIE